jgi:hypothetical protein
MGEWSIFYVWKNAQQWRNVYDMRAEAALPEEVRPWEIEG